MQILINFMQKTGVTPVNHAFIVQERLLEKQPHIARVLYDTFEAAKLEAYRRARQTADAYFFLPENDFARQAAVFGKDPYPSGISANRGMLALLIEQLISEGQLSKPPLIEHLFAESTRDT